VPGLGNLQGQSAIISPILEALFGNLPRQLPSIVQIGFADRASPDDILSCIAIPQSSFRD
jgi:hypothetical protein